MKKIVAFTMVIIVVLICAFTFAACGEADSVTTLVMNKRYINEVHVSRDVKNQSSYVFHSDGTGEYTYHYDYSSTHEHYIIHFKYTYVDSENSAVVCFYDSMERLDGDDGKGGSTGWSNLITVSKNVLATVGPSDYVFWINEDYLKTIPNFRQ